MTQQSIPASTSNVWIGQSSQFGQLWAETILTRLKYVVIHKIVLIFCADFFISFFYGSVPGKNCTPLKTYACSSVTKNLPPGISSDHICLGVIFSALCFPPNCYIIHAAGTHDSSSRFH